jgi:hypothetical protein
MPIPPFLEIEFNKYIPDTSATLVHVAGLIACFIIQGDPYLFEIDFIGDDGRAKGLLEEKVLKEIWTDIKPYHIQPTTTFAWIHKQIHGATRVSSYPQQTCSRVEKYSDKSFNVSLGKLPGTIGCFKYRTCQWSFPCREIRASKRPNPESN